MRPQTPTCLSPRAHNHVPPCGFHLPRRAAWHRAAWVYLRRIGPTRTLLLESERARERGNLRAPEHANWSGLVWSSLAVLSGCLAWLGLAGLGIRRSPPPASSRGPSICSVVNVHASLCELCHIQPRFLFKEHFS